MSQFGFPRAAGRLRLAAALVAAVWFGGAARASDDAIVVRVRVLDERGRDRADAAVEVRDPSGAVLATGRWDREHGVHEVAVPCLKLRTMREPFGPVHVAATAPGLAERYLSTFAGDQSVTLRLPPRRAVTVTVRAASGEPLAGAMVGLSTAPESPFTQGGLGAQTDAHGRVAFPEAGEDAEIVGVMCPCFVDAAARVPLSGKVEVTLQPEETATVEGRVVRAEDGSPLAGARVHRLFGEPVATDADGRFRTVVLGKGRTLGPGQGYRPGESTLVAEAPGYMIETKPVEDGPVDFRLRPTPPLRGTVVDPTGPVAGGTVTLLLVREWGRTGPPCATLPFRVQTDSKGGFAFEALPDSPLALLATADGCLPAWLDDVAPGRTAELRLIRGSAVAGSVHDDAGAPVPGAAVVLLWRGVADFPGARPAAEMSRGPALVRTYADEKGRFVLAPCPVGEPVEVYAVRKDLRSRNVDVVVAAGTPATVDLLATARLSVSGVVLDETGRRVAPAHLVLQQEGQAARELDSSDGGFQWDGLPLGQYKVTAEAPGHVKARAWPWAGETVNLTAHRMSGDAVLVLDLEGAKEGDPAVVTIVHRLLGEIHFREEAVVTGGKVRVRGLPAGRYAIDILVPGFEPARIDADVRGPECTAIAKLSRGRPLRILAGASVAVEVTTLRGRKAPDRIVADAEGRAEIFGIGPGRYRFVAREPGHLVALEELEVGRETSAPDLDLRTGEAARLDVLVVGEDGAAVRDATIVLVSEKGWEFDTGARTDDEGRARVSEVLGGAVAVVAAADERQGSARTTVAAGGTFEVTVVVRPASGIEESD